MSTEPAATPARVQPARDVRPYFHEQVTTAIGELGMRRDPPTASYLAELLSDLSVSRAAPNVSTPLADLLAWAMDAVGSERAHRLRYLGDVSLFVCGFFPESFERRGLSYRYVVSMGRSAYGQVGSVMELRKGREDAAFVFNALAMRFGEFVRVLDEVREQSALRTPDDVPTLCARWHRSRSPRIARRLRRLGLHAIPGPRRPGRVN